MNRLIIRKGQKGFTLIELMIVVAIVGILAVLAIYGVRKYLANAKTAEARNALGQLSKDSIAAYERESMNASVMGQASSTGILRAVCGTEPGLSGGSVPGKTSIDGKKYQSAPGDWEKGSASLGFKCLHFSIDQPQYYAYGYTAAGVGSQADTFTATATGNLNGDAKYSTFSISGAVQSGALNVAPSISETDPDE